MKKVKYNVIDDEGTLIDTVWEAPEHVGGSQDAVKRVAIEQGIDIVYLRAVVVHDTV